MSKKIKILFIIFIAAAFLGFLDSLFLTFEHYNQASITCVIFEGCDKVTASPYSVLFGLPVALFGAVYYLSAMFLAVVALELKKLGIFKIVAILTSLAFAVSLYFLYLQVFVIRALCVYCLFSILTSTALFVLSIFIINNFKTSSYGYISSK